MSIQSYGKMKIIIELLSSFPAMPRSQPRRSSVGWGSMILAMLLCVAMGRALIVSWRRPTEHEALRVAHVAKALHGQLIEKNTEIKNDENANYQIPTETETQLKARGKTKQKQENKKTNRQKQEPTY